MRVASNFVLPGSMQSVIHLRSIDVPGIVRSSAHLGPLGLPPAGSPPTPSPDPAQAAAAAPPLCCCAGARRCTAALACRRYPVRSCSGRQVGGGQRGAGPGNRVMRCGGRRGQATQPATTSQAASQAQQQASACAFASSLRSPPLHPPTHPPAAEAAVCVKGAGGGYQGRGQVLPVYKVGADGVAPHLRAGRAVREGSEGRQKGSERAQTAAATGTHRGGQCMHAGEGPYCAGNHAGRQVGSAGWRQLTMPKPHSQALGRCW